MKRGIARRDEYGTRAFRVLLGLYPGEFRDEYGRELALVFGDRYRDATTVWQRAAIWVEAIAGLLREVPKEHARLIVHDLRFAARSVLLSPGFAATIVLTLALGIGANTAIFQLISAVHFRALPVPDAAQLIEVRIAGGTQGFGVTPGRYGELTRPVWDEVRAQQEAFSGVFAWTTRNLGVGEISNLRPANGIAVSGEFFHVLGIHPFQGRLLDVTDEQTSCPASKAVVSYGYWTRELAGRPIDAATRLRINGDWYDIVGVTPPTFFGLAVGERFDIAHPFCQPAQVPRQIFDMTVMGRLRPEWTVERASAHLDAISPGIFEATAPAGYSAASSARYKAFRLGVYPAAAGVSDVRERYDTPLRLLFGITTLVLLIASANLANLLLARAIAREREVSIRLALGGSRTRLVRQFLAESMVLAAAGTLLGVGVAQILSRALIWMLSNQERTFGSPELTLPVETDWRLLSFTAVVAVGACLMLGVLPALRATRADAASTMKSAGRTLTPDRRRFAAERLMVVTQIAVSIVLLVGALLFVRSFRNLVTFDPGMRQAGVTIVRIGYQLLSVAPDRVLDFQRELLREIRAVPGVSAAGTTSNVPLLGSSWGHGIRIGDEAHGAQFTWVSPGYLEAMGIQVLEGRDFSMRDTQRSQRVAVVNRAFVRRFANGLAHIGQTLRTNPEPNYPATDYEIVGIIPDTQYNSLRGERPPMVFAPDTQHPSPGPYTAIMVYSTLDARVMGETIRRAVLAHHPGIFIDTQDLAASVGSGLARERVLAVLAAFFGGLATLLAIVGVYGMITFLVAARRAEIGVRLALGARSGQIVAMMMRQVVWLLALGVPIGAGVALLAAQSARALLFRLEPHDPTTIALACLSLIVIAAAASLIPARRASRLDPLASLRSE